MHIPKQFLKRITLSRTTGYRRNLGPIAARRFFVDYDLEFHMPFSQTGHKARGYFSVCGPKTLNADG